MLRMPEASKDENITEKAEGASMLTNDHNDNGK